MRKVLTIMVIAVTFAACRCNAVDDNQKLDTIIELNETTMNEDVIATDEIGEEKYECYEGFVEMADEPTEEEEMEIIKEFMEKNK